MDSFGDLDLGTELPLSSTIPFIGILLSIALLCSGILPLAHADDDTLTDVPAPEPLMLSEGQANQTTPYDSGCEDASSCSNDCSDSASLNDGGGATPRHRLLQALRAHHGAHRQHCGTYPFNVGCRPGHQPLVDCWAKADWMAAQEAAVRSWHAGYYHTTWGAPVALVVPPTARMQTRWGWGVAQSTMSPLYHQFERPYPGSSVGQGYGSGVMPLRPTPHWPSHTDQFGVYYVRGPW